MDRKLHMSNPLICKIPPARKFDWLEICWKPAITAMTGLCRTCFLLVRINKPSKLVWENQFQDQDHIFRITCAVTVTVMSLFLERKTEKISVVVFTPFRRSLNGLSAENLETTTGRNEQFKPGKRLNLIEHKGAVYFKTHAFFYSPGIGNNLISGTTWITHCYIFNVSCHIH